MIPSPNLDDRSYQDIMSEAIRLIPRYCPEWTNYNPTDPGMTILELFAWMTEMTIYRINKVPDKTYAALLDLMGLALTPPRAARGVLFFTPVESAGKSIIVRKGLQVSAGNSKGTGQPVIFETEKELLVSPNSLESVIGTRGSLVSDYTGTLKRSGEGCPLFGGTEHIERSLYIGTEILAFLADANIVSINFTKSQELASINDELVNFLSWSYWNGQKWLPLKALRSVKGEKRQDNQVFFEGPLDIQPTELDQVSGWYIRADLESLPEGRSAFEIDQVLVKLLFHGDGLNPDVCMSNTDNMVFHNLDVNKDFSPFVGTPKLNDCFYLASQEILSKDDSRISIHFSVVASDAPGEINEDLRVKFEYFNGKEWLPLGECQAGKKTSNSGPYDFFDSTECLGKTGEVSFNRPPTMKQAHVNGQELWWIRARITAGDFGSGGQYRQTESGSWEWQFDKPIRTPSLNRLRLKYNAKKRPVDQVKSWFDFAFHDFKSQLLANEQAILQGTAPSSVPVFAVRTEEFPTTYFGFSRPFPQAEVPLYFRLHDHSPELGRRQEELAVLPTKATHERRLGLEWQYWNGTSWAPLTANDGTDQFHQSGFVEFPAVGDMQVSSLFGKELFWIRLVFKSGSFERAPRISKILLNGVSAWNWRTWTNEVLGSSNGGLSQEFKVMREPLLPGIELVVREDALPPRKEQDLILAEEGADAIQIQHESDGQIREVWIRYHEVPNFHASGPLSRHYTVDYQTGRIIFGDGQHGLVPPRIKNGIMARRYRVGGGLDGNVAGGTLVTLRDNVPYIAGVINHYPAEGGADLEDMEHLKYRAAGIFRSLNRAVTREDYEWLALESSASVARAHCLSRCGQKGEVRVIIVPSGNGTPIPSPELLRCVQDYLDDRRLIGTRLSVEVPVLRPLSLRIRITLRRSVADEQDVKDIIEKSVRVFLDPVKGGAEGRGWPFGMALVPAAFHEVVESIQGVHHLDEVRIYDPSLGREVEKFNLQADELPFVQELSIDLRRAEW